VKFGLNAKTLFLTVTLFVVNSTLYSAIFTYQSEQALLGEFRKRVRSLAQNLAINAELGVLVENREALESLAQSLLIEPDIQKVRILGAEGELLAEAVKAREWSQEAEMVVHPVLSEASRDVTEEITLFFSADEKAPNAPGGRGIKGGEIGWVELTFTTKQVQQVGSVLKKNIFWAATFATVVGCGVVLIFTLSLLRPVKRLARATSDIAEDHWEGELPVAARDEIGSLTESFNRMALSLRKKREELEATYKELAKRERMAEMGKFAMMIAHEVKNPLGIIKGSVDLMAKESTQGGVRATLIQYIQDEVKRLNRLAEDFLAFTKPMATRKEPVNINELMAKIASLSPLPESEGKEIALKAELEEGLHLVQADEGQLYQAMLNLLTNAVQAIPREGEVALRTQTNGRWVVIQVEDTGTGIREEDRPNIFEPFYTNKEKGTGLGLSIVKRIANDHGGELEIGDGDKGGTVFTLKIPS
jgi:signal transduction histidine kinase